MALILGSQLFTPPKGWWAWGWKIGWPCIFCVNSAHLFMESHNSTQYIYIQTSLYWKNIYIYIHGCSEGRYHGNFSWHFPQNWDRRHQLTADTNWMWLPPTDCGHKSSLPHFPQCNISCLKGQRCNNSKECQFQFCRRHVAMAMSNFTLRWLEVGLSNSWLRSRFCIELSYSNLNHSWWLIFEQTNAASDRYGTVFLQAVWGNEERRKGWCHGNEQHDHYCCLRLQYIRRKRPWECMRPSQVSYHNTRMQWQNNHQPNSKYIIILCKDWFCLENNPFDQQPWRPSSYFGWCTKTSAEAKKKKRVTASALKHWITFL